MFDDQLQKTKKEYNNTETGDSQYIYQNELDKFCFQHGMAYGDFKDLTSRTASDKTLHAKHLILLKTQNIMDINADLLQWFINILIKKLLLHEQLNLRIVVLKMRIIHSSFRDKSLGTDLADMQLISKFNKGFGFFLCVIDIFSKYASFNSFKR